MIDRISEAEQVVMEALWDEAPLTAAEVAERIPATRGWRITTVKTMLARLLAKGVLTHEEVGRRFLYRPIVSRDDYAAQESTRLIDRLFGGKIGPLVAQLAQRDRLTDRDIAEIEALLKALKP